MKPRKVLLFIFLTIVSLGVISLLFPKDGITIGSFTIHFPTLKEIFTPDVISYADISDLQKAADTLDLDIANVIEADLVISNAITPLENLDNIKTRRLEFPDGQRNVLASFFHSLDSASTSKKLVRILHYGDSQIEGDRITHYLRRKLQSHFGGSGPGIVPVVELYNSMAVKRNLSGSWQRFTLFGNPTPVKKTRYGAMASLSRFSPVLNDSTPPDTVVRHAGVTYKSTAYPFSQVKVFAGNANVPAKIEFVREGEVVKTDSISDKLKIISCNAPGSEITINFSGYDSPDIYAIDLSGGTGVMVDNIPMRGSSGTLFTRIQQSELQTTYNALNVELFILQFGGNVIPYTKTEKECVAYGNWFYSQLMHLKKARPSASIIVIGPSDMSYKEKEHFVTYPLLEKVRDALKEATFKAGGAYWDMYEAMGGRNSMPAWVEADPPLAASDYTHFSPRGARLIAEMFYNALILEYQLWKKGEK